MKTQFCLLITALFALLSPFANVAKAEEIAITTPNGGETLTRGSWLSLMWSNVSVEHYGRLAIELKRSSPGTTSVLLRPCYEDSGYSDCNDVYNIAKEGLRDRYYFRLPNDLAAGEDYKMVLYLVDDDGHAFAEDGPK